MVINTLKNKLIKGILLIAVCFFSHEVFAVDASFINGINVQISGATVTKNAGGNSWNAGAASENVLEADVDGHVEVTAGQTDKNKMIGLSATDNGVGFNTISYAIYLSTGGSLKIYESGSNQGTFGTYTANDVFRVQRSGSTIEYLKNGTPFHSTSTNANTTLIVDMSIYSSGGSFQNVTTSFDIPDGGGSSCSDNIQNGDETGVDCGGSCAFICESGSTHDIVWVSPGTNVSINGNNLTKNAGGSSWNAGTGSENVLAANTNGWIEVAPTSTTSNRMVGLSTVDANANFTSINYAFYMSVNGNLKIYENGTNQNINATYAVNDVLRIERSGSVIFYKKNGEVLKTSIANPSNTLLADVSIHTSGGTVSNVTASFEAPGGGCNTTVYADTDGDGYGNPDSSIVDCSNPAGYVSDNTDCDDTDSNINPDTVWYQDSDSDGFGNAAMSQTQCEQPVGYVLNSTDCDDTTNDPSNNCGGGGTAVWTESGDDIRYSGGKVWIGNENLDISSADYNLFVEKGIITERVKVALDESDDWPDFVFKKSYKLSTIDVLKEFIAEHGHLPNMPSAEKVAETGIDIAKMDAMLLQQIEESKLYIIELNEKIKLLEEKIQQLEK